MRERRARSEVDPGVGQRVVLPCVGLSAGNVSSVIAADDINLASGRNVTASCKAVHIRHVRASSPCVGRDIVNPGDVIVEAG